MSKQLILSLLVTTSFFNCRAMEYLEFVSRSLQDMKTVGTVLPLSDSAARHMASIIIFSPTQPYHYLEIGAGIGNITKRLVEKLGPNDTLDVVEILAANCSVLNRNFGNDSRVKIHQADFLTWHATRQSYNAVVSTLPHTTLGWDFTKSAFDRYTALTNGRLLFVQLAAIHRLKCCNPEYQKITGKFEDFKQQHNGTSTLKWSFPCGVWIHETQLSKGGSKKSS